MKKLLHSFLICLGILMISSQVFAQNAPGEKLQPYVGGTYNYKFTGIADGLDYEFYFSSSSTGKGTLDNTFTGYIVGTRADVVPASGEVSVNVAYPVGASTASKVYLFLKVYDADVDAICENYKAVEITPIANAFDVTFADATVGGNPSSCPDLTNLQAVIAPSGTYNAGTSELTFTATRDVSSNEWSLNFDIVQAAGTTVDYTYSVSGGATIASTAGTASKTVNIPTITTETVTITLIVQNYEGEVPVFTINNITAVDEVSKASPASTITGLTHTIKEIPEIGAFE